MPQDLSAIILEMKARQDINDVLVRYCRGADRGDVDLILSCFHDGACDDHGFFNGLASEFAHMAVRNLGQLFIAAKHYLSNVTIEMRGESAFVEGYILAIMRQARDDGLYDVTLSARYLDQFERRDGVWKITHRTLVSEGTRVDRVVEQVDQLNQGKPGGRGAQDPSHAFFSERVSQ